MTADCAGALGARVVNWQHRMSMEFNGGVRRPDAHASAKYWFGEYRADSVFKSVGKDMSNVGIFENRLQRDGLRVVR